MSADQQDSPIRVARAPPRSSSSLPPAPKRPDHAPDAAADQSGQSGRFSPSAAATSGPADTPAVVVGSNPKGPSDH
eukprot:9395995-Pyramimonas_sp.AAC.1